MQRVLNFLLMRDTTLVKVKLLAYVEDFIFRDYIIVRTEDNMIKRVKLWSSLPSYTFKKGEEIMVEKYKLKSL